MITLRQTAHLSKKESSKWAWTKLLESKNQQLLSLMVEFTLESGSATPEMVSVSSNGLMDLATRVTINRIGPPVTASCTMQMATPMRETGLMTKPTARELTLT
jgi:hypothetical protein